MGGLVSLLIISLLIFFHELGHFLFARLHGVKVEIFSIGFGSTLFRKSIGETEYRISLIPFGGYVKMKGQDDLNPSEYSTDRDSYNSKSPFQRFTILFGGPLFNFLLAFILFVIVGYTGFQSLAPVVGDLQPNSPAIKSGLERGDRILAINGDEVESWKEMAKKIENSDGELLFQIERRGAILKIAITPKIERATNIFGETIYKKMIGISPSGDTIQIEMSLLEAIQYGFEKTISSATIIFQSVEKLITGIVSLDQVGGVVSIFQYTAKASEEGITTLLVFTALLSVNLGVLNLLPIPALDGGHILFVFYEMVTRRRPSENTMTNLTILGWVVLGSLMVVGLYNDIVRLFQ